MNNSNTFKQGDSFEERVFKLLKLILENDDFFVPGKKSKIFRKKAYYSKIRESNIIFDITIETYMGDSKDYSLLTIIECKNYKSAVPVNDIEEFSTKIKQIGEHNTKGIVVSNNSFQEGSYRNALNTGLGLIRVKDNDEFEWIVRRKENVSIVNNKNEIEEKFVNEKLRAEENFIANINGKFVKNLADVLIDIGIIDFFKHKEKFINIPFVTEESIDKIITKLESKNIYNGISLDVNKLCSFLETVYPITFDIEADLENNILGKIEFEPLKIKISKSLKTDVSRQRFTIAHEIGHLLLHYKILLNKITEKTDTDLSFSFLYNISEMTTKRLEYQANIFASHLLLPVDSLINIVEIYFTKERIHKRYLYWDHQPVNQQLTLTLLNQISLQYQVSIEVARIRLISLGLLVDDRFKSIRDVLKELKFR